MQRYAILLLCLLPIFLTANTMSVSVALPSGSDAANPKGAVSAPGYAQLPAQTVNILLPADAADILWQHSFSGSRFVAAEAPPVNSAFFNSEQTLQAPQRADISMRCVYLGIKQWGDLRYASFRVLPAVYDLQQRGYLWDEQLHLNISYSSSIQRLARVPGTYRIQAEKGMEFFANAADLDKWYRQDTAKNYDILIISTPALYASFSAWEAFRNGQGFVTSFADIATILSQSPGSNAAERLRNYLSTQYALNNFTYLLLIGDHDTIPVAMLTPEPNGMETVPSDFYFSDLSSIFDTDSDGRLGEFSLGMGDQDWGVDFTPEVFVGRISTNSTAAAAGIAQRIVAFEQSSADWKNKALLPAAFLNYQGEPELIFMQTDGADFTEYERNTTLSGMDCTTMYEQIGVVPSHPSDYDLSYENLAILLNSESFGILNWSAHGSATSSARKVWVTDGNQNNIPDSFEMEWMNMVNLNSFNNLTNNDGMVIFAASCYNGMIDNTGTSLAEQALIKKGVAVFGATRTGWYKIGWRNPGWGGLSSYNHHLLENYARYGMSIGAAHAFANLTHTQYYMFGDPVDSGGIIWPELQNVYTYLLFGDPLVGHTATQSPPSGEILVWEPTGSDATAIVNAINATGRYSVIHSDRLIPDYDYINRFEAVFCLLGWDENTYTLTPGSLEYNLLNGYLENGGRVYLEGMVAWDPADPFWAKFGTHAPLDMPGFIENIHHQRDGQSMLWSYNQAMETQILVPALPTAVIAFNTQNNQHSDATIGIWHSNGSYATLASSFRLALINDINRTLEDMIAVLLDTLAVGEDINVANIDPLQGPRMQVTIGPNPFRSVTSIQVKTADNAAVRLDIYNIRGQKVRSFPAVSRSGDSYEITWDGHDEGGRALSSGLYILRFSAGKQHHNAKAMLIK